MQAWQRGDRCWAVRLRTAGEVIEAFEREADTEELRNAARQSEVLGGPACLWDTYQDGRLIYADLVRAL